MLATAAAVLVRDLAAPRLAHPEAVRLRVAGWSGGAPRFEGLRAAAMGAALCGAVITGVPLWPAILAGAALPSVWLALRASAARQRARRATVELAQALHGALASGSTLPDALRRATDGCTDALAARPFRAALEAFALGAALDDALRDAAGEAIAPARPLLETLALGIGERLPGPRLAVLAAEASERLRSDEQLAEEVRARTSGARMQLWLLAALVPALATYLYATVPSLRAALDTRLTRDLLLPAAAAFELAGLLLAQRVVRGALP